MQDTYIYGITDVEQFIEANNLVVKTEDLTKKQFLDCWLKWNGIVGYTDDIIAIINELFDEIDEIDFDEKFSK